MRPKRPRSCLQHATRRPHPPTPPRRPNFPAYTYSRHQTKQNMSDLHLTSVTDVALSKIPSGKSRMGIIESPKVFNVCVRRGIINAGPVPKLEALGVDLIVHRVTVVRPNSPAERHKLLPFDRIIAVDGLRLQPSQKLADVIIHKRAPTLQIERAAQSTWTTILQKETEHLCKYWLDAAMAVIQSDLEQLLLQLEVMSKHGVGWMNRTFTADEITALQLTIATLSITSPGCRPPVLLMQPGMHLVELALQYSCPDLVNVLLSGTEFTDHIAEPSAESEKVAPYAGNGKGKAVCHQRTSSGGESSTASGSSSSRSIASFNSASPSSSRM
eukprot:5189370-Pleurochrysis_carterae.AAC.1